MPRITELTKEEALAIAHCFVETNHASIWHIVDRKLHIYDCVIPAEDLAEVRHFARSISHLHTDTLFYKWFSPAKKEIKEYLEEKIKDPTLHIQTNALVLYRHLFKGNKEVNVGLPIYHAYAECFAAEGTEDERATLCTLARQGVLPAMDQYKKKCDYSAYSMSDFIAFGFECAISVFLTERAYQKKNIVLCHQVLKTTNNLRVVEYIEKILAAEEPVFNVPHSIIIQFFGHQCEKNVGKARQLLMENRAYINTLLRLFKETLASETPIIDDPVAFFKFILENEESALHIDDHNVYAILQHVVVDFAAVFPLCLLPEAWISSMIQMLNKKLTEENSTTSLETLVKITRLRNELQEYMDKDSEFYKRRLAILEGRTYILLETFTSKHSEKQKEAQALRQRLLDNNFKDYYHPDDSNAIRALKEQCLSLYVLHPEHVILPAHIHSISSLPTPITYTPPSWINYNGSFDIDPSDWASIILNNSHEHMYRLSMRLGVVSVFNRLSDEDKKLVTRFNGILGWLLSEIKEDTLTAKEKAEIRKQIDECKRLPAPVCKNAEFLEAALEYVPRGIDKETMSTLLVGHPYRETLFLAANIDSSETFTQTADQYFKRAKLWLDPIAFAAFLTLELPHFRADPSRFLNKISGFQLGLVSASSVRLFLPQVRSAGPKVFNIFVYPDLYMHWYLTNKHFQPAIDMLEILYRPSHSYSSYSSYYLLLNCIDEIDHWTRDTIKCSSPEELTTIILRELTPGLPLVRRKIVNWQGQKKEILINYILSQATLKPTEAFFISGYFALALHDPAKIIEAVTHLSKIPLNDFTPKKVYLIALQIKEIYFDNFTGPIPDTETEHYSKILEWTLSLLSIIFFPKFFLQQDASFNVEAAEELYTQLESIQGSTIRDESIVKRVRHRHAERNHMISGAQLTMIDLMPVDSLERSERSQLLVMRDEAERGHLFLEDTVYSFQSSDAKALLNNLLLLSGEKKSVSREPTIDHFIMPETVATHDSGIANNDSEIVATFGGGGGGSGEARPEASASSISKFFTLSGRRQETVKEGELSGTKEAVEKRTREVAARMKATAKKERRDRGINGEDGAASAILVAEEIEDVDAFLVTARAAKTCSGGT